MDKKMSEKIMCVKCSEFVPRENIKFVKGVSLCSCCLTYNNINYEALSGRGIILLSEEMQELIRQKEQEQRARIRVIY